MCIYLLGSGLGISCYNFLPNPLWHQHNNYVNYATKLPRALFIQILLYKKYYLFNAVFYNEVVVHELYIQEDMRIPIERHLSPNLLKTCL